MVAAPELILAAVQSLEISKLQADLYLTFAMFLVPEIDLDAVSLPSPDAFAVVAELEPLLVVRLHDHLQDLPRQAPSTFLLTCVFQQLVYVSPSCVVQLDPDLAGVVTQHQAHELGVVSQLLLFHLLSL